MKSRSSVSLVVGGIVIVAFLITLMTKGGWLVWIPTLTALGVVFGIFQRPRH